MRDAYTVFHVGSGAATRRWSSEQWTGLARRCTDAGQCVVLLGLGADDVALGARVSQAVPGVVDLVGCLKWEPMIAAIRGARVMVGLDSASMHVASATQVPAVCVATGVVPLAMWHPPRDRLRVIATPTPCAPCYLPSGCEGMECIRQTAAETVFDALLRVMS